MPELIDKTAAYNALKHEAETHGLSFSAEAYDRAARIIDQMPTIEPEVRRGRWIPTEYDSYADGAPVWDKWECSECGHEHSGEEDTLTAFCPDCGTKMDATDTNVGGKGGADNG